MVRDYKNLDFTHSSRKAWTLITKLGSDNIQNNTTGPITPNEVATRLVKVEKIEMDKTHSKEVTRKLRSKKKMLKS